MRALVAGGADCVWRDLEALGPWEGLVVCVNDIGASYPGRVDHWVSIHANKFPKWEQLRRVNGGNRDYLKWTQSNERNTHLIDRTIAGWRNGSSSFLAVGVAFEMGASEVVLCGVPMQAERGHFFDPKPWEQVNMYTKAWEDAVCELTGRVYSMSGWTRDLLGPPPWLG